VKPIRSEIDRNIAFPELFFGIVAPIGVNIQRTIDSLEESLFSFGYKVVHIKISDYFKILSNYKQPETKINTKTEFERYRTYIKYGNQLRRDFNRDSLMAELAIAGVCRKRSRENKKGFPQKQAFIISQFKRSEEIEILRNVYGLLFFQVSIYSRRSVRVDNLSTKLSNSSFGEPEASFRSQAEQLITIDENEAEDKHGQRVSKIFHDADFIVNEDSRTSIKDQTHRFISLLFGSNSISPNKIEYGMFLAKAAALRTLDLSRQVGAAILTPESEIIALGSNEVPKAGGGTYWADSKFDDRDYKRSVDPNDERKGKILQQLLNSVGRERSSLSDEELKAVNDSIMMDALEYGRIVHAEMSAITDAARIGRSVKDATIYSTTFPCHMCAKHIVAAGIKEVCFLEPYPKSLAATLHGDSIEIEGVGRGKYNSYPAVKFFHFSGVTPRRFRELFSREKRKDKNGNFIHYKNSEARPVINVQFPFYFSLEIFIIETIETYINHQKALSEILPKKHRG
jgi:deoxycytidylate deaminase